MARGAMRGIAFGALGLIALEALLDNANQASGLVKVLTGLMDRALDPSVPLIPDHSSGSSSTGGSASAGSTVGAGGNVANGAGVLPPALANLPTAPLIIAGGSGAAGANSANGTAGAFGPGGLFSNLPSLHTYATGQTPRYEN